MGDLYAVTALLLFSANAFLVRAAARRVEQQLGFLVVLVANVLFALILVAAHQGMRTSALHLDWPALGLFAVAGVFSSYLGRRGYFRTVQTIGPARATAIQNSSPALALVLAWVFLGQALGPVELSLMGAIVCGLYLTSSGPGVSGHVPSGRRGVPTGEIAVGLLSAAAYAAGNVFRGGAMGRWQEPVIGALVGAVTGTLAYFVLHISPRRLLGQLRAEDRRGLLMWCLSGVLMICGQTAVIASTAQLPVAVAVAVSAATPVVVIPVSVLLLGNGEQVTARVAAGALLIVGGVTVLLLVQ